MSIRKSDNESKYPQEVKEALAAERLAEAAADAERTAEEMKRKEIIIQGLKSKYGFSQNGAEATMRLIEKGSNSYGEAYVEGAKFATPEMAAAAGKAFEYFWKI